MISLELNNAVVLEQQQVLEQALSTNPKTQKALQKLIRQVIMEARAQVVNSIKFENGDPHQSARAVRTAVYKKILGANINIYSSRKLHGNAIQYEPPRRGTSDPKGRGGNRRKRSQRTQDFLTKYGPLDRGFILRWQNDGTKPRYAGYGRNGKNEAEYNRHILNTGGRGFRGNIAPRNFFKGAAERVLVAAADKLANLIDTELEKILNQKK